MNRPRPLVISDPVEVLDELDRMKKGHQNDAQRHLQEAERVGQLRDHLQEHYREQLAKKRSKV